MLRVDTNPFKAMVFNQQGGNGFDGATSFVRENFNTIMYPNAGRRMPQNFGQQQRFGISQALSGNMSPMQLQGMNNMQPYQPTMTNPQYPEQEFITGRRMPQNFGQQQRFGISQALSGNMSPMQLQGMNNMQPYQPTMTNPQYPEQEFITGNPMLYR